MSEVRVTTLSPLRRQRRAVRVQVLDGGREVDSFEMASAQTLNAALQQVSAHLDEDDAVRFQAIEEQWLPLGIVHVRHEEQLTGLSAALHFLVA